MLPIPRSRRLSQASICQNFLLWRRLSRGRARTKEQINQYINMYIKEDVL